MASIANSTQVQTSTATLIGVAAGYASAKGWLGLDLGAWTALLGALIALWPALVTRLQSLKNTVGNSGAIVVTSQASAAALPDNSNVIAATPAITAQIGTVQ